MTVSVARVKACGRCKSVKPLDDFGLCTGRPDKRAVWCSTCAAEYQRERRRDNPEVFRAAKFRKKYGISLAEYDRLAEEQNGLCAICGRAPETTGTRYGRLVVDHDHETDEVRGLLCAPCNSALGLLGDDPDLLMSAASYLLAANAFKEANH